MVRSLGLCLIEAFAVFAAQAAVPVLKNAPEPAGNAGIKVRPLQGGQVVQSVAPKAMFYRFRRGEEKWQESHFDVLEFWRAAQRGCLWKDRKGNELVVATLLAPFPSFEADHAKREDIEAKMAETADAIKDASDEMLASWVSAYSGADVGANALKEMPVSSLDAVRTVDFGKANRAAAVFRTKSGGWHYAAFSFAQPAKPAEVARLLKQFLSAVVAAAGGGGSLCEGRPMADAQGAGICLQDGSLRVAGQGLRQEYGTADGGDAGRVPAVRAADEKTGRIDHPCLLQAGGI